MWEGTMPLRTALKQTRWLTVGAIAVAIWAVVVWFRILDRIEWTSMDYVGRAAPSGVVGLVVLAALIVLLVALFGELGEEEPAPERWPPE